MISPGGTLPRMISRLRPSCGRSNISVPTAICSSHLKRSGGVQGTAKLPGKAVLLSFDDAYESFYNRVFPALQLLRVPAVLSVVTSWIENPRAQLYKQKQLMNWAQIREVSDSGLVTVASHSHALHKLIPANPQGNLEAAGANLVFGRPETL